MAIICVELFGLFCINVCLNSKMAQRTTEDTADNFTPSVKDISLHLLKLVPSYKEVWNFLRGNFLSKECFQFDNLFEKNAQT